MREFVLKQAKEIALRVVQREANPNDSCEILANLCHNNGWPDFLASFSALAHEQTEHEGFGFNRENTAPLIIEACEELLKNFYHVHRTPP